MACARRDKGVIGADIEQNHPWDGRIVLTATLGGFIALILLGVLALTRQAGGHRSLLVERASLKDPLRVVDEMFASGEIDLEDYQIRRAQLRKLERG